MSHLSLRAFRAAVMFGCCGLFLAGCGNNSDQPAASKGQVVARVGDQVVTTQELDNEFRSANIPPDRQKDPEIVRQVLRDLVTRKYLLQQAVTAKLDREPGVLLDLLRAREQVLEKAFLTRGVASRAPAKADIEKFIADNPFKFAKRKVYSVEQLGFPVNPTTQSVINTNKNAKSLEEIDDQLTSAGIPHSRQIGAISSADLPSEFYNAIEAKKPDDVFFVRAGQNGIFFKVKGEELRPLEGEAALGAARQILRADALKADTSLAAYSASLEAKFEGSYGEIMQEGAATPAAKN